MKRFTGIALRIVAIAFLIWSGMMFLLMHFPMTDFSAEILSAASARGVDVASSLSGYYLYVLVACPLLVFAFRNELQNITVPMRFLALYRKWNSYGSAYVLVVILVLTINLKALNGMDRLYVILIGLGFLWLEYWGRRKNKQKENRQLFVLWLGLLPAMSLFAGGISVLTVIPSVYFFLFLGTGLLVVLSFVERYVENASARLMSASLPVVALPIFQLIALEVRYSFQTYGVFLGAAPFYIVSLVCFLWAGMRWRNSPPIKPAILHGMIVGAALCASAFRLAGEEQSINLFEGANAGLTVYGFAREGAIPFLQNFDAHMLAGSIWGIFYHLINNDPVGALFTPYGYINLVIGGLAFYYCLCQVIGSADACVFMMLFPFFTRAGSFMGFGWLAAVAFLFWTRIGRKLDAVLGLCFGLLCLYRLDVGVSIGGAVLLAAILYLAIRKDWKRLTQFLVTQIVVFSLGTAVLYAGLITTGGDLVDFINQFMTAALSNQHWAYGQLPVKFRGVILYLGLPLLGVVLAFRIKPLLKSKRADVWLWLVIAFAFLLNLPRGVVRHSLLEQAAAAYVLPILLIGFGAAILVKRCQSTVVGIVTIALMAIILRGTPLYGVSAGVSACVKGDIPASPLTMEQSSAVKITEKRAETIANLRSFFDATLRPEQTYLDFTDQALLYAFMERKSPFYINQIPAMVNGRKGQELFLREALNVDAPFVLMPFVDENTDGDMDYGCLFQIDGIKNTDRFFLITEYIGKNYRPLCKVDDFAIWCKKGEYEYWRSQDIVRKHPPLDGYAYNSHDYHKHNLGEIPRIWYMFDETHPPLESAAVELLASSREGVYDFKAMGDNPSYLVIGLDAEKNGKAQIVLSGDMGSIVYTFNVKEGEYKYRVRPSSDILWYSGALENVKVELPEQTKLTALYLLPAD